jgi:hypothetical protein
VIQAPPNAINSVMSATVATVHEARLSIEAEGDCNIQEPGWRLLLAEPKGFDHPSSTKSSPAAALRQNAQIARRLKFPSLFAAHNEIDRKRGGYSLFT